MTGTVCCSLKARRRWNLERKRQEQTAIQEDKQARIAESAAEAQRTEDAGNESAWEGFETETEDVESIAKKRSRRKTPAEQNKARRKLEAARLAKHEGKRRSKEALAANMALTKVSDAVTSASRPDHKQINTISTKTCPICRHPT